MDANEPQNNNQLYKILLIAGLGIAVVIIISVLSIQIIELRFYGAANSVWPGKSSGTTPVSEVQASSTTNLPDTTTSDVTAAEPVEALTDTNSAVTNTSDADAPTEPTPKAASATVPAETAPESTPAASIPAPTEPSTAPPATPAAEIVPARTEPDK